MTVGLIACRSIAAVALVVALVVAGEGSNDGFEYRQHRRLELAFVHPVGGGAAPDPGRRGSHG